MPIYIVLSKLTDQGVRNLKAGPQQVDAAQRATERVGGRVLGQYMTLGEYDFVTIVEAPDDLTYARLLLSVVAGGDTHPTTLKAFTEEDYRQIIAALP